MLRADAKNFRIILERDLEYRIYHHITTKIDEKYISCLKNVYSNGELIGNCININFIDYNYDSVCKDGWYPVEGKGLCCPEPNMQIIDGYCE